MPREDTLFGRHELELERLLARPALPLGLSDRVSLGGAGFARWREEDACHPDEFDPLPALGCSAARTQGLPPPSGRADRDRGACPPASRGAA